MAQPIQKKTFRKGYIALALATITLAVNFWAWSLLSPLGTQIGEKLVLSPLQLSLLLAAPIIVGSLGRIPLGFLCDKFGGQKMFIVMSLLTILPVAFLGFADGYNQFILGALLLGFGGATFVIGIPYINAWFPPARQGFVLGIYGIGDAGTAVSGFMMPWLAHSYGFRTSFIVVAVILAATAFAFMLWGKDAPSWKPSKKSPAAGFMLAVKQRLTWDLSLVYAVTFGAFVAFGVYLPVLLSTAHGLGIEDSAARAAGFIIIATVARPIGGWLSDIVGGIQVIRVSLLLVVILATSVAFQSSLELSATATYLSLAFALGCASGAVFALIGRRVSRQQIGGVSGIVGAAGGLGGFFPPLVMGIVYQQFHSYSAAFILLAIAVAVILLYVHRQFSIRPIYQ